MKLASSANTLRRALRGQHRPIALLALVVLSLSWTPLAAPTTDGGETYYVGGENCDDPSLFCSFEAALGRLEGGDTLVINAGVYTDRLVITDLEGRADAPILIRGESTEAVVFDGGCLAFPCRLDSVNWQGDEETGMITIENSRFVTLSNLTVQNVIAVGVKVSGGSAITVSDVTVHGTGNAGLLFKYLSELRVTRNKVGFVQLGHIDDHVEPQPGAHEALSVVGVKDFLVAGNYVHDTPKEGIDIKESSSHGDVRDNFVERACAVGIYINEAFDTRVFRNRIRRSGYFLNEDGEVLCKDYPVFGPALGEYYGTGILLAVGDLGELSQGKLADIVVYQNVVWDAHANGLEFWDELRESGTGIGEMTDVHVYNNVLYNTGLGGIRLQDASRVEVVNNVLALNNEGAIVGNAVSAATLSHNLFWFLDDGQRALGASPVVGDPRFVDPVGGDFHLREASPAIDAALDVGLPFTGIAPDMGAFEYGTAQSEMSR